MERVGIEAGEVVAVGGEDSQVTYDRHNFRSYLRIERPAGSLAGDTANLRPDNQAGGSNFVPLVGQAGHLLRTWLHQRVLSVQGIDTAPDLTKLDIPAPWQVLDRLGEAALETAVEAYPGGESARSVAASLGISKSALLQLLRDREVPTRPHTLLSDADVLDAGRLYQSGLLLRGRRQVRCQRGVHVQAVAGDRSPDA